MPGQGLCPDKSEDQGTTSQVKLPQSISKRAGGAARDSSLENGLYLFELQVQAPSYYSPSLPILALSQPHQ